MTTGPAFDIDVEAGASVPTRGGERRDSRKGSSVEQFGRGVGEYGTNPSSFSVISRGLIR